jgi:hypothetical protein
MIRIYLSPPTEAAVDFFNDRPQDPLMGRMIRQEEMESQWVKILNYVKNDENSAIDIQGYEDTIFCLMYVLKTFTSVPLEMFELINGEKRSGFYLDEEQIELQNTDFFGESLSMKWLF